MSFNPGNNHGSWQAGSRLRTWDEQPNQLVPQAPSTSPHEFQHRRADVQLVPTLIHNGNYGQAVGQAPWTQTPPKTHSHFSQYEQLPSILQNSPRFHSTQYVPFPATSVAYQGAPQQNWRRTTTGSPGPSAATNRARAASAARINRIRANIDPVEQKVERRGTPLQRSRSGTQYTPLLRNPPSQSSSRHQEPVSDLRGYQAPYPPRSSNSTLPPKHLALGQQSHQPQPDPKMADPESPPYTDSDIDEALERWAVRTGLSEQSPVQSPPTSTPKEQPDTPSSFAEEQPDTPSSLAESTPEVPQAERRRISLVEAIMAVGDQPGQEKLDNQGEEEMRDYFTRLVQEAEELTKKQMAEWEVERLEKLRKREGKK